MTTKHVRRALLWAVLFLSLCLMFYLFGETSSPSPSTADEEVISLLDGDQIHSLSMGEYLVGAVAAEMPVSFGTEALKAQAVAIRTYALAADHHEGALICTDSACCLAYAGTDTLKERWGQNYDSNLTLVRQAVAQTGGEYMIYEDEPIQAVFHASSGGFTEDSGALWGSLPYLRSVATPETARNVENLVSTVSFSSEALADALELDPQTPPSLWLQAIRRNDSGRVKGVLIGDKAFTGPYLRQLFGLRSTDFDLAWDGTNFVFTVTGHGHGVGMSQYGAKLLAAEGWSYDAILAHYYPGTELVG